jgi:hypothetical protein
MWLTIDAQERIVNLLVDCSFLVSLAHTGASPAFWIADLQQQRATLAYVPADGEVEHPERLSLLRSFSKLRRGHRHVSWTWLCSRPGSGPEERHHSDIAGRVTMSQKIPSTAAKAGMPNANQVPNSR